MFEFLFSLLFEHVFGLAFGESKPTKIEVRLLASKLSTDNKTFLEIENITEKLLQIDPTVLLFFDDNSFESRLLNLEKEKLTLSSFTPIKISFDGLKRKKIKKIQFELKRYGKLKVKVIDEY